MNATPDDGQARSGGALTLVFFGTPDFAVPSLQALCEAGFPPALVVTQPPARRARRGSEESSPVAVAARHLGLPVVETEAASRDPVLSQIKALQPDILVVVAFGQILRRSLLESARYGAINLHPSDLPRHRGAAPVQRAILEGVRDNAICVIRLVKEVDAGPVLRRLPWRMDESLDGPAALQQAAALGAPLVVDVVRACAAGQAPEGEAQHHPDATHAPMLQREDGHLDFRSDASALVDRIRAVAGWPRAECRFLRAGGGPATRLLVHRATADGHAASSTSSASSATAAAASTSTSAADLPPPGTVLRATPEGVDVQCGHGVLRLLELQVEGKPRRPVAEFLRGFPMAAGDLLAAPGQDVPPGIAPD